MKKGFTLTELLAVIVILGLLSLLLIPNIQKVLKDSKEDLYVIQEQEMIDEAKNWIADHPHELPKDNGDELVISLGELKLGAYIDLRLTNPKTSLMFDDASKIIIKRENNKYNYSVQIGNLEEEVKDKDYPKLVMQTYYLTYFKVGDSYDEPGISVDGEVLTGDNDKYSVSITNEMGSLSGTASSVGNYLVTYEITNKQTGDMVTVYRNIIVKN